MHNKLPCMEAIALRRSYISSVVPEILRGEIGFQEAAIMDIVGPFVGNVAAG